MGAFLRKGRLSFQLHLAQQGRRQGGSDLGVGSSFVSGALQQDLAFGFHQCLLLQALLNVELHLGRVTNRLLQLLVRHQGAGLGGTVVENLVDVTGILKQLLAAFPRRTEVVEDETATLRYVGEKGLRPGRRFTVEERSPDGEAMQLQIDGGRTASVSKNLAALIWVRAA